MPDSQSIDQICFENGIIKTANPEFIPDSRGVGYTFFTAMSKYKDKVMQIDGLTGEVDTYGTVLERSIRTAIKMKSYGVTKDDIITICSLNNLNICVPLIASMFLGAKVCSLDPLLAVDDAIDLVRQIDPKLIFASAESVDFLEKIFKANKKSASIIVFGDRTGYVKFSEFVQPSKEESGFAPIEIECIQDTCFIVFSSGTTGLPKGFCVSHQAYLGRIGLVATIDSYYDVTLSFTRLYWASAIALWGGVILAGGTRIVIPQFNVHDAWLTINKYKPTFLFANAFQMATLCDDSYVGKKNTSSLKTITLGGSSVFEHQLLYYRKCFPNANVFCSIGATEIGQITYFPTNNKKQIEFLNTKLRSVGTVLNGLSYKVVDVDSGKVLGPLQQGELLIKTTNQISGYFNADSSHVIDSDGWVNVGDIMYFDEDFYFYHVERTKELIKFRFGHLPPKVIEDVLLTYPKIQNVCVIGTPHELEVEQPLAVVVLKNCKEINDNIEEDIIGYVAERLEDKYRLRGGVKIIDELPLTVSGKVDRRRLKRMVLADNKLYLQLISESA